MALVRPAGDPADKEGRPAAPGAAPAGFVVVRDGDGTRLVPAPPPLDDTDPSATTDGPDDGTLDDQSVIGLDGWSGGTAWTLPAADDRS